MTVDRMELAVDEEHLVTVNGDTTSDGLDLFNSIEFHNLHRPAALRAYYFVLRRRRSGIALGIVHFLEAEAGHFESPHRGSFGGFAIVPGADVSLALMEVFAACVEAFLLEQGARRITIVLPPLAYRPAETSGWINVLLRSGFSVARHELSYAIDVGGAFAEKIDYGNRKQLHKCERAGLTAYRLERTDYEKAYAVIEENRRKKGNAPSMTWAALQAMCDRMPERVRCFGVRLDDRLIAAAVCLLINARTLYVFYWGEIAGVETLSPVTFLANHIYDHCLIEGIALLDLGTATLNGIPNHGLIRYKKHLGCHESLKLTLAKVTS